jgi:hypothetical protein
MTIKRILVSFICANAISLLLALFLISLKLPDAWIIGLSSIFCAVIFVSLLSIFHRMDKARDSEPM